MVFLILLILLTAAARADAGTITVELDFKAARSILALPGTEATQEELTRIAELPGVQALIRHGARFDPRYTKENFISSLREFSAGRDPKPDPFNFARVRDRLMATRELLRRIESNPDALRRDIIARMRPYAPDSDFSSTLTLIASGSSDGFSPGRGQLFVAIDYFRDDWEGLVVLTAHELYHAVQSALLDASGVQAEVTKLEGRTGQVARLLMATLKEGTGSVVGDPLTVKNPGSYNAWFAEKFTRNLNRIQENFALFETILFRLAHDDAGFNRLYPLGFSGGWDSPLYFVGYRMARVIEKYDGREAIQKAWSRSPAEFFLRYAALARQHPDDADVVPLSDSTVTILTSVRGAR